MFFLDNFSWHLVKCLRTFKKVEVSLMNMRMKLVKWINLCPRNSNECDMMRLRLHALPFCLCVGFSYPLNSILLRQ